MQAYPNYSQPMMNNPYQNYGQPIQNPYMAQMGQYQQNLPVVQQLQQPQQQAQQIGLNCRVIDDFNSIVANDVPMDGNGAVFMKRDASEVQWRNWAANGTIQTTVYRPVQEENKAEGTNIPQMDFNSLNEDVRALREDIMARLDVIEKSVSKPNARGKKTEVSADE